MNLWDILSKVNINNKEKYQKIFADVVHSIQNNKFPLRCGETEKEDYYLVVEPDRIGSYFVHIVPKQAWKLFKEMQENMPHSVLGFSVLAGVYNNREVRVSCFGVPCNLLGKSLAVDGNRKRQKKPL